MNKDSLIAVSMHVSKLNDELDKKQQWIEKAIPFLKAELCRISDEYPLACDLSEYDEDSIERLKLNDHELLTYLLTQVGALEE